jgi:hypothetical protein
VPPRSGLAQREWTPGSRGFVHKRPRPPRIAPVDKYQARPALLLAKNSVILWKPVYKIHKLLILNIFIDIDSRNPTGLPPRIYTACVKVFQGMTLWISILFRNRQKTYPRLSTEFPVLRKYRIALPVVGKNTHAAHAICTAKHVM